jgi:putative transposase
MHTSLVLAALRAAVAQRSPPRGLMHHSDRGSQYVDEAYLTAMAVHGLEPSMSRKGNCYDNASCNEVK